MIREKSSSRHPAVASVPVPSAFGVDYFLHSYVKCFFAEKSHAVPWLFLEHVANENAKSTRICSVLGLSETAEARASDYDRRCTHTHGGKGMRII